MGVGRRFVVVAAIVAGSSFVRHARAQMPPREVTVHLEARPDVTLERREDNDWVEVCFAPCDLKFPTLGEYRVGGGIRDSDPFRLRQTSPGLSVVAVDPRSRGAHAAGDVLIGVGSALTAVSGDSSSEHDHSPGSLPVAGSGRDTGRLAALPPAPTPPSAHGLSPALRSRTCAST